ncbi:hypothetical protein NQZ68_023754, partial [Dissostichus eleginoides]
MKKQDIECNVTESAERTEYSISDSHRVSEAEAPGCGYSWANSSNNVLAHEEDKDPELVVKNGINNLITYTCFDNMVFKRLCKSEGQGYTAYCARCAALNPSDAPTLLCRVFPKEMSL